MADIRSTYPNGRFPPSALSHIPGGNLSRSAAAGWNAGPAKAGLRPLGPNSSYRTYAAQVYFWNLYQSGRGNLAARPGTSNHGWGNAVDLAAPWMRAWIDRRGAQFGWRKVEAPGEWWHVNYVGGFSAPRKPDPLRTLKGADRRAADRLLYHRREMARERRSGEGPRYRRQLKWARFWKGRVARRMDNLSSRGLNGGPTYRTLDRVLKAQTGRL